MAAPDGSVIVPLRPAVPADCATKDCAQNINNIVNTATRAGCERSSFSHLIIPFSFSASRKFSRLLAALLSIRKSEPNEPIFPKKTFDNFFIVGQTLSQAAGD